MTRGKGFGFGSLHKALRGQSAGFTLIEVIIAISLLAVGMLTVASMQVSAITGNAQANRVTEATTAAQDKLEELMALPYTDTDLTNGQHADTDPPYDRAWTITDNPGGVTNTKRITVTVSGGNLKNNVVLTSVIINPNF
jgi:prepilin-type N-terminal cleavage/methylation domain-containing protein